MAEDSKQDPSTIVDAEDEGSEPAVAVVGSGQAALAAAAAAAAAAGAAAAATAAATAGAAAAPAALRQSDNNVHWSTERSTGTLKDIDL